MDSLTGAVTEKNTVPVEAVGWGTTHPAGSEANHLAALGTTRIVVGWVLNGVRPWEEGPAVGLALLLQSYTGPSSQVKSSSSSSQ